MSMDLPSDSDIVINGKPYKLRLTLGALAAIEDAFGGDFTAIRERLKTPRISDFLTILHALIHGGGAELTLEILRASDVDFTAAAIAIGKAFRSLSEEASRLEKSPTVKAVADGGTGS